MRRPEVQKILCLVLRPLLHRVQIDVQLQRGALRAASYCRCAPDFFAAVSARLNANSHWRSMIADSAPSAERCPAARQWQALQGRTPQLPLPARQQRPSPRAPQRAPPPQVQRHVSRRLMLKARAHARCPDDSEQRNRLHRGRADDITRQLASVGMATSRAARRELSVRMAADSPLANFNTSTGTRTLHGWLRWPTVGGPRDVCEVSMPSTLRHGLRPPCC